ncbi:MAG: hypothetical protein M3Q27_10430 [Actinomycetota bacterium]|nr:hypothetical protein [Actinomycetota bacterium]
MDGGDGQDSADRLTRLAAALAARLQGDDGEFYDHAPVVPTASVEGLRRP